MNDRIDPLDTFDALHPNDPGRGAGAVLAAAQHQAARAQRRRRVAAAVAAVVLLAASVLAVTAIDDDGSSVETDPGPVATEPTQPSDPTADGTMEDVVVEVHFSPDGGGPMCADTEPVERIVEGPAVLEAALRALLAGPTAAEREAGLSSWFSEETAGALRSVAIEDGTAFIDFSDFRALVGGASTTCGANVLVRQLDRTALQFPTVERTLYSIEGDVEAFYGWLQASPPAHYEPWPTVAVELAGIDLLLFGESGVREVVGGDVVDRWVRPVTVAHADGTGAIVAQDLGEDGPIRRVRSGEAQLLVAPGEGLLLRNVVDLDGQPTALFTRRTGGVDDEGSGEAPEEHLFAIELASAAERALGQTGGRESGLDAVALSRGDLLVSTCHLQCSVRVLGDEGSTLTMPDWIAGLDAVGARIASVRSTFVPETGGTVDPVLVVARLDGTVDAEVTLPPRVRGRVHVDLASDGGSAIVWWADDDARPVGAVLVRDLLGSTPSAVILEGAEGARFL
ncbi:MAG: GerMN domain-containing protein [Acidimicrobiales bacterium]